MHSTESLSVLKMELTQLLVPQFVELIAAALAEARPVHEVEARGWPYAAADSGG